MNKKDIVKIARQLYLQELISRQLFAKFDLDKQLGLFDGSFAKLPQRIQAAFYPFIGSVQRKQATYPQIVQKNGMKFKIHKMNIDNSVSDQIYNDTEYDINQVSFILRKLYVSAQKGGQNSFKNNINQLQKLWSVPTQRTKGAQQRCQTIIDKLQQIKQIFIAISDFIVGDIQFISSIRQLQQGVSTLKDKQNMGADTQEYDVVDAKMWNFIQDFKLFATNKKTYASSINMAVNRLKSFLQLYNQLKAVATNSTQPELLSIVDAMEKCNTNEEVSRELRNLNLKKYLDKSFTDMTSQDDSIQSFIRFIKTIDNGVIQFDKLFNALDYYLGLQDGVLSDNAIQVLKELKESAELLKEKAQKQLDEDDKVYIMYLHGDKLEKDLINKIKNVKKQLV